MVVRAARRAAREGDEPRVRQLDRVMERLGRGMTAGEELALDTLVTGPFPLTVDGLCDWSDRLPATGSRCEAPSLRLEAAIVVHGERPD
jgi:hypothetical protein